MITNRHAIALKWKYPQAEIDTFNGEITRWECQGVSMPPMDECESILKDYDVYAKTIEYRDKRASRYPALGDSADIAFKQRQKARRFIEDAQKSLKKGDLLSALNAIIDAITPVDGANDYDEETQRVKDRFPKGKEVK